MKSIRNELIEKLKIVDIIISMNTNDLLVTEKVWSTVWRRLRIPLFTRTANVRRITNKNWA